MPSIAEPGGKVSSSSAARAWTLAGYRAAGGQIGLAGSEPPSAQAPSEVVTIARTIRGSFEHAALNFIGFLRSFETLRQAPGPFNGTAVA
jgi:hypothetical protein